MTDTLLRSVQEQFRYRPELSLLFNWTNGNCYRLDNEVSQVIVEQCLQGVGLEDIVQKLSDTYEIATTECRKDVESFLTEIVHGEPDYLENWDSLEKSHSHKLSFPLRVEFELTALCNWQCGFCYNVWKIDPKLSDSEVLIRSSKLKNKHVSKDDVFRMLEECAEKNVFVVRYSGGETMLNPDFFDIIEYGAKKKLYQVVFTNGHFLNDDAAKRFRENNVKEVLISLHGLEDTHVSLARNRSAYDKAVSAIKCCVDNGISVIVESILVKESIKELSKIVDHLSSIGVTEWRIMRYVATGRNDDMYEVGADQTFPIMKFLDEYITKNGILMNIGWPCSQNFCTTAEKKALQKDDDTIPLRRRQIVNHCEAGVAWCSVSYDGKLRTCPHSDRYFGDAAGGGIAQNWQQMTDAVWDVLDVQRTHGECKQCALLSSCRGGCHLESFLKIGH